MMSFTTFQKFISTYFVPMPSTLGVCPDEFDNVSARDLEDLSPALYEAVAKAANCARGLQFPRNRDGNSGNAPLGYQAVAIHETHGRPHSVAGSDALIITRFVLAGADKALLEILGRGDGGVRILNLRFGGVEVFWNRDLVQALERRTPIFSRVIIRSADGDVELEHLAVPDRSPEGGPVVRGWFNTRQGPMLTSSLIQCSAGVSRTHRGRPITLPVLAEMVPAAVQARNEEPGDSDCVLEFRRGGVF